MSYYRDNRITITPNKISIRGMPIPVLSGLVLKQEDIQSIRTVDRKTRDRLIMSGPVGGQTWNSFDPWALFRSKAVVISLKEPLPMLGIEHVALTFSDFDAACGALGDNYSHFLNA